MSVTLSELDPVDIVYRRLLTKLETAVTWNLDFPFFPPPVCYHGGASVVGYLSLNPVDARELQSVTPPWVVCMPGQVAAVNAFLEPDYYRERYRQTHHQRKWLEGQVASLGLEVVPGTANFFVAFLGEQMPTAAAFIARCRKRGLFLRDVSQTSPSLGQRAVRFAVKCEAANQQMIEIIAACLSPRSV